MTNACWQVAPGFTITKTMALDPQSPYSLGFHAAQLFFLVFIFLLWQPSACRRLFTEHHQSPDERKVEQKVKCNKRMKGGEEEWLLFGDGDTWPLLGESGAEARVFNSGRVYMHTGLIITGRRT